MRGDFYVYRLGERVLYGLSTRVSNDGNCDIRNIFCKYINRLIHNSKTGNITNRIKEAKRGNDIY